MQRLAPLLKGRAPARAEAHRLPGQQPGAYRGEIVEQSRPGHRVDDEVMYRDEKPLSRVGHPVEEADRGDRPAGYIQRRLQPLALGGKSAGPSRQVDLVDWQVERARAFRVMLPPLPVLFEPEAQRVVPLCQPPGRFAQQLRVELAVESQQDRLVEVVDIGHVELEEPSLDGSQWRVALGLPATDALAGLAIGACCEGRDRGVREQVFRVKFETGFSRARYDLDAHDRVSA